MRKKRDTKESYKMVTAIGLPLLIVNGKFQSLGSMTVEDLETFIPFLTKCSVNRAGAQLINGVPEWWTSTIQFKFPLKKPNGLSQIGYRRHLSAIVCSCYWYHDAQYLLPFCAKIADSPQSVFLRNNADNTTSIFSVQNTSHMLKFNNENKDYDRKSKAEKFHRRSLLSTLLKKPTVIPDIYLCENCDAEFFSHAEMQKHEKECYKKIDVINKHAEGNSSNMTIGDAVKKKNEQETLDEIEILEHIKPNIDPSGGKNKFFSNLGLQQKNSENMQRLNKSKSVSHCRRWENVDIRLYKNGHIEFSSVLGRRMLVHNLKPDFRSKLEKILMVNEYYCSTRNTGRTNRDLGNAIDFRVTTRRVKKCLWTHQYSFNRQQKRSRYLTLKTGLNEHSRKLLKQCKRFQVVLNRLKIPS